MYRNRIICCILIFFFLAGCRKLIMIPPPAGTITNSQVFSTDDEAVSAAAGMYYKLINSYQGFASLGTSLFCGMSADELIPFDQNVDDGYVQFYDNNLVSINYPIGNTFWQNAYSVIYQANAIIEGLSAYSGVHDSVKNELIGEAEFVRAFCNFYLVNLFGPVPLPSTINWNATNLLSRADTTQVYQAIVSDLQDAQLRLRTDYAAGQGQRIVPNKWAATAMLSRVNLYLGHFANAALEADSVIQNTSLYSLDSLNSVFLTNSTEAIWQLQQSNTGSSYNATPEGFTLIPLDSTYAPFAFLTDSLLMSFEPNDNRKIAWIDSTNYNGTIYYFPYKYKMGPAQAADGGPYTEYYMVLRLAEQFLISAEAKAQMGNTTGALTDLNDIRNRAGIGNYTGNTDKSSLLNAIYHERRVELFAEWGNRWLDLKRTGLANSILTNIKGFDVDMNALLYPIPLGDIEIDPNLVQNKGY